MDAGRYSRQAMGTVVCGPSNEYRTTLWTLIAFGVGGVLGFVWLRFIPSSSPWVIVRATCFGSGLFLFPMSIWAAAFLCRASIIADAEGLRWRGAGRWQTAPWESVVAYSDYWPSPNLKQPSAKVQTLDGTLVFSPPLWTNTEQLRSYIARFAVRVTTPEWKEKGGPRGYLPLNCNYDTATNRNILRWLDNLHKYGLAAVAVYFAYQWFTTHTLPGWEWLLTPTGLFVLVKQALPLVLRPMYRATQPRLGDKVIADEAGLRFVTTQSDTVVCWEDITDFYRAGIRSVVVTDRGKHDFLDTLTDAERLRAVIPLLAVNAGRTGWRRDQVLEKYRRL